MVDVDYYIQSLVQGWVHQGIGLAENLGAERVFRTETRVMVPADRDPNVIEPLGADLVDVLCRVGNPPVLSGWSFQPVPQVRAAEEPPRGQMGRSVMAGDAVHFADTRGSHRARVHTERHRLARGDPQRTEERLVMPGSCIMCSVHGGHIAGLLDDGSSATLPTRGLGFEAAINQFRSVHIERIPENFLPVDYAVRLFFPRAHEREGHVSGAARLEPDRDLAQPSRLTGKLTVKALER